MRLSEENARRLSALVWRDRARRWVPALAVFACGMAALTFLLVQQVERADPTIDVKAHGATVLAVRHTSGRSSAALVRVHLEDGRDVEAFSTLRLDPSTGAHVIVNEVRHASGKLTYDITRITD